MNTEKGKCMQIRRNRLAIPISALLACFAVCALVGAQASSAATCKTPKYPGEGYFTTLSATGTSCTSARSFVVEYYKCRVRNGGRKGRCTSKVRGYSCTEKRTTIPTEINARVTCKNGTRKIVHTYQQNT